MPLDPRTLSALSAGGINRESQRDQVFQQGGMPLIQLQKMELEAAQGGDDGRLQRIRLILQRNRERNNSASLLQPMGQEPQQGEPGILQSLQAASPYQLFEAPVFDDPLRGGQRGQPFRR